MSKSRWMSKCQPPWVAPLFNLDRDMRTRVLTNPSNNKEGWWQVYSLPNTDIIWEQGSHLVIAFHKRLFSLIQISNHFEYFTMNTLWWQLRPKRCTLYHVKCFVIIANDTENTTAVALMIINYYIQCENVAFIVEKSGLNQPFHCQFYHFHADF